MSKVLDAIRRNPVRTGSIVLAFLSILMSFGLELTAEQVGAITAFLSLLFGEAIRPQVTPGAPPE